MIIHNIVNSQLTPLVSSRIQDDSNKREYISASMSKSVTKYNNEIKKEPAEINFCGSFGSKPKYKSISDWFYNSDKAKWLLEKANDHNLIFSAAFALLLTCILRPASIMILPSKKNQDDQKYAAAHSIASGVIGFAISTAIFTPLQNATNKLKERLDKNLESVIKNKESYLKNGESRKILNTYLERLPDVVFSAPKGILTVALIPPILKYVFGWEKKKPEEKNMLASKTEQNNKGGLK